MSTARQQMQNIPGPVPRLTPSAAETIRSAAEAAAGTAAGRGPAAFGLLLGDTGSEPDLIIDAVEMIPCSDGAGDKASVENLAALREKANQVRALPHRQIAGLVCTWSPMAPGFSLQENATLREIVPEFRWLFIAKTFPDGRSRVRALGFHGQGWFQAADLELAAAAPPPKPAPLPLRAAAFGLAILGRIPPFATACIAILALVLVGWACLHTSRPAPPLDLGMRVGGDGSMLGLSWDRRLDGVRSSRGAVLRIDDGGRHRDVRLDSAQVANGLVLYRPASDDVTFRLNVQGEHGAPLQAAIRWIDASGATARAGFAMGQDAVPSGADDVVQASHPAAEKTPEPQVKPAARRQEGSEGVARFVVKTPGARVTIRKLDETNATERLVTADSLRLPTGRWIVRATAPGYHPWTGRILVNRAGPADVFIRLREARRGRA